MSTMIYKRGGVTNIKKNIFGLTVNVTLVCSSLRGDSSRINIRGIQRQVRESAKVLFYSGPTTMFIKALQAI